MADVTGPISTLPGAFHAVPDGMMCDMHPDVPAIARVQGETDSFGSELNDMCQACLDEYKNEIKEADTSGKCDWCGHNAPKLRDRRDYEEGMSGRVYLVCDACVKREYDRLREEEEYYESKYEYARDAYYDAQEDYDDDKYNPESE